MMTVKYITTLRGILITMAMLLLTGVVSGQTLSVTVTNTPARTDSTIVGTCLSGSTSVSMNFPLIPAFFHVELDADGDGDSGTGFACLVSRRTTPAAGVSSLLPPGSYRISCAMDGTSCFASTICGADKICTPE